MEGLPAEIWVKIFGLLSPGQLARLCLVCTSWNQFINDPFLWRELQGWLGHPIRCFHEPTQSWAPPSLQLWRHYLGFPRFVSRFDLRQLRQGQYPGAVIDFYICLLGKGKRSLMSHLVPPNLRSNPSTYQGGTTYAWRLPPLASPIHVRYEPVRRGVPVKAYVVVYDVTDAKTFADATAHVQGVKTRHGPAFVAVILVGNKKDLHDKRAVTTEEGLALAAQHNIGFIETSALTGEDVTTALYDALQAYFWNAYCAASSSSSPEPQEERAPRSSAARTNAAGAKDTSCLVS